MLQNCPPPRNIRSFRAWRRFKRPNKPKAAAVNSTTERNSTTGRLSSDISANILDFAHSATAETGLKDRRGRGAGTKQSGNGQKPAQQARRDGPAPEIASVPTAKKQGREPRK